MSQSPDLLSPRTEVTLTNCDREPIHLLGRSQSFGCLLAVTSDWKVSHASRNCGDMIGRDAKALLGAAFADCFPQETVHFLRTRLQLSTQTMGPARVFSYPLYEDARLFDISIHTAGRHYVFEFEPRADQPRNRDLASNVQALIARIRRQTTFDGMVTEAVRALKALGGYDRVMLYRFEADQTGSVIAEAAEPGHDPYLGLRYPASDIPVQARALYARNLLRIIGDIEDPGHPVLAAGGEDAPPLDMSMAVTRAVSPVHLEYMRNMGVAASLSASILRRGALWGLFACHHATPRHLDYETRSAIELFAQLFNQELSTFETDRELADSERARDLHDRISHRLSGGDGIAEVFDAILPEIRDVIPFDGAAISYDGRTKTYGFAPTDKECLAVMTYIDTRPTGQLFFTDSLGRDLGAPAALGDTAAGVLALPLSRKGGDYLLLFRRALTQTVVWAGKPEKIEQRPGFIAPRQSFAAWREIVRDKCDPWRASELRTAEALRVTLIELVLKLTRETMDLQRRAEAQQELLIAELNHRLRNILNLIRGLLSQGRDGAVTVADFTKVLENRIRALARAHDQLTEKATDWASLRGLIETEVRAYLPRSSDRVRIDGDAIDLSPEAFTTLALTLHEMVTNAAKYGALSGGEGRVSIDLRLAPSGNATLSWRESGGPAVRPPSRRGFGTTIIDRSIPYELGGRIDTRFPPEGFEADLMLSAAHVRAGAAPRPEPSATDTPAPTGNVFIGTALVVEDNMIIAMDTGDMLSHLGASYVQTVARVQDALQALEDSPPDLVVADVNLGAETSRAVVDRARSLGIAVVVATGYGTGGASTRGFADLPVLRKPFTIEELARVLGAL